MARYYRVRPDYWSHDKAGWTDRDKLLGLYLLTCEHRNLEGFYRLPKAYVAADLGWAPKTVDATLKRLISAGFCLYDAEAEVVLLPDVLADQAPSTGKQMVGALNSLERVPPNALWNRFLIECQSHCKELWDGIRDRFGMDPAFAPESNGNTRARDSSSSCSSSGVQA